MEIPSASDASGPLFYIVAAIFQNGIVEYPNSSLHPTVSITRF